VRVLIDYRPALRQRTGVGEYAHHLAAALVPLLGEPPDGLTLFSSSWKDRLPRSVLPPARTIDARVPVRMLNRLWHRWEWPPVELFSGPVDVAHAMHPLMIPARRAAQIVTIHDLYFLERPETTNAEIRRDYPALTASHARRADAVVAVSQYTASQVQARLGVSADRITVCPSGAPAWPSRLASGLAARPATATGPIIFVGTIEPRKNVGALLAAYGKLVTTVPSLPPLVLAGAASAESAGVLDELTRPPLRGRARHLGYVTDPERQELYRSASILVLPSLNEGFGIPVLEAMTVGVPVVAANRGALPELLGDAGLLVEPEDIDGIASAIARVLADQAFARSCAERGLTRARQYTWAGSAARLMKAYAAAIERRSARH
jgi:glycosyltransferase involved in cell wall biosynthesis